MKHIFYHLAYILPVLCLYDTAGAQINTSPYEFTEIFRIGDEARGDTILFMDHLYTDMAVNSINHLFIGGYRQSPVISFSDEGHFVGFVGAEGVGPGEFKGSRSVIVGPEDSVYVYDSSLRRLLVFKPGTLRYAYSMNIDDPPESSPFNLLGVTENGYLFKYSSPYRPPGDLLGGHDPDESRFDAVNLVDKQGAIAETSIARLPAKESVVRTYSNREGSGISVMSLPFGRASFFILNNSLLYSGWNDAIDITITSENGEVVRTIEIAHEPLPVTRREVEIIASSYSRENRRAILKSKLLPKTKPAYDALVVDDQGHIWIREYPAPESKFAKWLIADTNGRLVGEMELPTNLILKVIRAGRAYGSIQSDTSGPYIAVYAITK